MTRSHFSGPVAWRAMALAATLVSFGPAALAQDADAGKAPVQAHPGGPGSIDGVWSNINFSAERSERQPPPTYKTSTGEPVPLLPEAAKVFAERTSSGKLYIDDSIRRCVHHGMPAAISVSNQSPLQFVETPDQKQITVLYEQFTTFRIINMDRPHPAHPEPSYMGDAVGHWDGDTLVVDTIAVSDKTTIMGVIPHSDQLHLVERIRRTGADTLEDQLTLEDPKTFSKPWTMRSRFKRVPGMQLTEFVCENNRTGAE